MTRARSLVRVPARVVSWLPMAGRWRATVGAVWPVTAVTLLGAGQLGAAPQVVVSPINREPSCTGAFVAQPLPHAVEPVPNLPMPFDSNGAGAAIADLDGDGWLDVVLGGLHGPATVLWNRGGLGDRGGLAFEAAALELVGARAVSVVDVDGDGHQDIVATRTDERPRWLQGSGGRAFRGVEDEQFIARHPIFSMAWADLDGDQDLDLVGATYDAELERYEAMEAYANFVKTNVSSARTRQRGVWYYENLGPRDRRSPFEQGEFQLRPRRLAEGAMALAIVLIDVDGDALSDIVVGNDYDIPDNVFLRTADPTRPHRVWWRPGSPFPVTTRNTMGFATGDVDNDGQIELFAADMSPYRSGPDIDEAWGPLLQPGGAATPVGDGVQAAANVLQTRQADGSYVDTAARSGVAATGWSWSAQFGDLDNDGDLDLYTVNGMIGDPFRNLENAELVEENQALRNVGGGRFVAAPEWGLGATASGRGMALGDLDRDGDLDIVVNNYRAPSLLFENRLCGGASLQVDLIWAGTVNPFAIGASVRLDTTAGGYRRDVEATSGYLSGNPPRVHFGFPAGERPQRLTIRWPDGAVDVIDQADGLAADTLLTVTRHVKTP